MKIPDNTKIQSVELRVKDLDRVFNFYSGLIGLKEIERKDSASFLSAGGKYPYLVKLVEDKNAVQRPYNTTGLFHTAIRFPNRKELARVFMRLFKHKIKFQGFSDHIVSEAIYLADPEGNGVELYADRPREEWKWENGQIEMDTLPLNLSVLTNELDDPEVWNGAHHDTDIGHIHLNVSNLLKAEKIYSHMIGFNITSALYPGALFMSAGGYHHHIGANTWQSNKGTPPPDNAAGLISFTVKIDNPEYLRHVEDLAKSAGINIIESAEENPDGITILDFDKTKIHLR